MRCSQRQRTLPGMKETLGGAIRRLRTEAGYTLRGFAQEIGISAAHQSDIEYGRRFPGEAVLRDTAKALQKVGATFDGLRALDPRLDSDLQEWMQRSPEVGQMLRHLKDTGSTPEELLKRLRAIETKRNDE